MEPYLFITRDIITVNQSKVLLEQLNTVINSLYLTNENRDPYEDLPLEIKKRIIESTQKESISMSNAKEMSTFLNGLTKYIEGLPSVTLILAFSPSEKQLKEMQGWMEQNLNKKILLHTVFDPSVIAGMVVQYDGVYKDYSLNNYL